MTLALPRGQAPRTEVRCPVDPFDGARRPAVHPGHPNVCAAYGYGGNGITFSFLASRMIASLIKGDRKPWFDEYAIDRPAPAT